MFSIIRRVLFFLVPFSLAFWYIHELFESVISRSTQNGLAGFYSVDGIIFGLILAFVIQREWETWTKLSESVRTEIDSVREMWKWSNYAEAPLCKEAHKHLESYLQLIIAEWNDGEEHMRSETVDAELDGLRGILVAMSSSVGSLAEPLRNAFINLIQARNQRLNFSNEHMPVILKRIVFLTDILLIILSLFIAVNNVYLDYIFTASIGLLAFALILVVDDLDNPFRPGTWHLTAEGYERLLEELKD
ncbi:MAG: hypothetical protein ABSE76_00430 [Minisyncoccia bacterium]|jgi:hypothetical protein